MKPSSIQKLVEQYELQELENAELAITNEEIPEIEIEGEDEGEKLTHVLAAIWIKKYICDESCDFRTAVRQYMSIVRQSFS